MSRVRSAVTHAAPEAEGNAMRTYYDIHLGTQTIERHELHGKEIVLAGRYLIAKTLVERG